MQSLLSIHYDTQEILSGFVLFHLIHQSFFVFIVSCPRIPQSTTVTGFSTLILSNIPSIFFLHKLICSVFFLYNTFLGTSLMSCPILTQVFFQFTHDCMNFQDYHSNIFFSQTSTFFPPSFNRCLDFLLCQWKTVTKPINSFKHLFLMLTSSHKRGSPSSL